MITLIIICTGIAIALGIYSVVRGGMHEVAPPERLRPREQPR